MDDKKVERKYSKALKAYGKFIDDLKKPESPHKIVKMALESCVSEMEFKEAMSGERVYNTNRATTARIQIVTHSVQRYVVCANGATINLSSAQVGVNCDSSCRNGAPGLTVAVHSGTVVPNINTRGLHVTGICCAWWIHRIY